MPFCLLETASTKLWPGWSHSSSSSSSSSSSAPNKVLLCLAQINPYLQPRKQGSLYYTTDINSLPLKNHGNWKTYIPFLLEFRPFFQGAFVVKFPEKKTSENNNPDSFDKAIEVEFPVWVDDWTRSIPIWADLLHMGVEPKIGVFPPKWMLYNGKPY